MRRDPAVLGTVQNVQGAVVSIVLGEDTASGLAFIDGEGYRIGQVGSFVRIPVGYTNLYGVVSQVGAGAVPERLVSTEPFGHRWMTAQLIGEGRRSGEFQRGISLYPTIGDDVHLVTEDDLRAVYGRPDAGNAVRIGALASADSIPALVDVDRLLTRHCAVVGTTGAGKSTTVASLLMALSDPERYPSARLIVIDIHGEYAAALQDRACVFRVNPKTSRGEQPLHLPYWAMTFDELMPIAMGSLDDAGRGAVLEQITALKLRALAAYPRAGVIEETLTVDTPVPYSIHRLWSDLHRKVNATHTAQGTGQSEATEALLLDDVMQPVQPGDPMRVIPPRYKPQNLSGQGEKIYLSGCPLNIRRPVEVLASRLRDPRFDFLFRPGEWCPDADGSCPADLDSLLRLWLGTDSPVTILDLSGIPSSILTNLVGVLLRIVYDALFWSRNLSEGGRERPLLLVLEEAHSYLGQEDKGPAGDAVRRIVKEGRKYGIGAMIVSQRPAEIDPTVLSQCGTIFAMRLSNPVDCAHVTGTVSDNLVGLFSMLPVLRTGEAIVVGEATPLPMRVLIEPPAPHRRPDSSDPLIYDGSGPGGWNSPREPEEYGDVGEVWRRQHPASPKAVAELNTAEGAPMQRVSVVSSNIVSIGYEIATSTLEIEFKNGRLYQYFDVPEHVHDGLMGAESHGEYFSAYIKGAYRYAHL
jgi:DNA helicase HerA-like ATPase